jgi:hypothetical protein
VSDFDPSQCRFCRWWRDAYSGYDRRPERIPNEYDAGQCRRRSPKSAKKPGYGIRESIWPPIKGDDWCGDFERFRNAIGMPNSASHVTGA